MKKFILSVAIMLASTSLVLAGDNANLKKEQKSPITCSEIVAENDSTPHIVSFYGVERIEIKNDTNVHIKIYNSDWKLIKETTEDVNLRLKPGNYYVACEKKIKSMYIMK